jgi:hypothetical protein
MTTEADDREADRKPAAEAGKVVDIATRDLINAVETLGNLIEENEEALRSDALMHPVDDDAGHDDPPFAEDLSFMPSFKSKPDTPGRHLDLFDVPAAPFDEPYDDADDYPDDDAGDAGDGGGDGWGDAPDVEELKDELIADLNALIDIGLRRVTDSAREHMTQEVSQELTTKPPLAPPGAGDDDPADTMSLSQAVGDLLSRYGLADRGNDSFYRELKQELDGVLADGIERIRRDLEAVLQARIAARAESQWLAMSAARERQIPGRADDADRLERPERNGDNPPEEFP